MAAFDKSSKHLLEMHQEDSVLISIEKSANYPSIQNIKLNLTFLFQFVDPDEFLKEVKKLVQKTSFTNKQHPFKNIKNPDITLYVLYQRLNTSLFYLVF